MVRHRQFGRMRALMALLLLALAATAAAGAWLYRDYQRFSHAPLGVGPEPVVIDIARGTSFRGVVARLAAVHLDGGVHELYWRALAWQHGARVQAGEYAIEASMTPLSLLEKLRRGEVIQYRFTLVEG